MPTFHKNKDIVRNREKYARKRGLVKGSPAWNRYVYGGGSKQFSKGKAGRGSGHRYKRPR